MNRMDEASWSRLKWRCRRGMLENDIILTRYLDAIDAQGTAGAALSAAEVTALDRLLDLADNELWDLLSGRTEAEDDRLQQLVRQMRAVPARGP